MSTPATTRRPRALIGASWTFLVIGLCALGGAEAKADCARDARHRVAIGDGLFAFDAAGQPAPGTAQPAPNRPRPRPCNGPSCSGNPASPVTTVTPAPPATEVWGLLAPPGEAPTPPSTARMEQGEPAHANPARSAIFHPPRRPA